MAILQLAYSLIKNITVWKNYSNFIPLNHFDANR